MASKASLENALRNEILEVISKALSEYFDADIITVGSGEISLPLTDAEGNEKLRFRFLVVLVTAKVGIFLTMVTMPRRNINLNRQVRCRSVLSVKR